MLCPLTSFTMKVNPRLAKRPLKTNGRLANRRLSSLVKEATDKKRACGGQYYVNISCHHVANWPSTERTPSFGARDKNIYLFWWPKTHRYCRAIYMLRDESTSFFVTYAMYGWSKPNWFICFTTLSVFPLNTNCTYTYTIITAVWSYDKYISKKNYIYV